MGEPDDPAGIPGAVTVIPGITHGIGASGILHAYPRGAEKYDVAQASLPGSSCMHKLMVDSISFGKSSGRSPVRSHIGCRSGTMFPYQRRYRHPQRIHQPCQEAVLRYRLP